MVIFEHALFMLLLLVGIFSIRLPQRRLSAALIVGGVLLVLIPPFVHIPIPWTLIFELTIPILFFQNARHWLNARWRMSWREIGLWLLSIAGLSSIFALTGYLGWPGALLFGIITASMLWRAIESGEQSSQISQIGPLTLIFLLTEIAPAVETPNRYLGGLFSGAAIGIGIAFLAIYVGRRVLPAQRGWIALGQVYAAYWFAELVGVSAIVAALISIAVFAEFSLRRGIEEDEFSLPAPMNKWPVFGIFLALFVFLGWQAHQPPTLALALEAILGFVVGLVITWAANLLNVPGFQSPSRVGLAAFRMGIFIFAALLLWPRSILLENIPLAVALGLAILTNALSATVLSATLSLQEET